MQYPHEFIPAADIPRARVSAYQHLVDTYASESNKLGAVWSEIKDDQLEFRPHPRSSSIREILVHQILSERRFFAEFLGFQEPSPEGLLPAGTGPSSRDYVDRVLALARSRLDSLAGADEPFWLTQVPFFDVQRQRIWVFWRRILHTAHHRAQVGVYLRLLEDPVPATYGPSADVTWIEADPTTTLDAARRRQP